MGALPTDPAWAGGGVYLFDGAGAPQAGHAPPRAAARRTTTRVAGVPGVIVTGQSRARARMRSGTKPCSSPHSTALVRLVTPILR